jgi:penicillin amidase
MTCPRRLAWLPVLVAGLSLILAASGGSFRPLAAAPYNPAPQDAGTLRQQARAALAQTSDDLSVAGLEQPVEVIRDRWGIPHIYARSEHDLFFAQGFVAAQDRLWQLDLWRRIDEGKLSELLGPAGLRRDTFARLLRYRGDWAEEWRGYGPRAHEIAAAFAAGINAQIDLVIAQPAKLPLEFQLTGSRPDHWTPEVVVGRMAGYVMTRNARTEVQRARLVRDAGLARAAEVMPTDPPVALAVPAGLDLNDITDNILDITTGTSESVDFAPLRNAGDAPPPALASLFATPADLDMIGSNDWVISGKRTASGKPLLANDPHRALMLPSLRYTVHLNAPGWNVVGAGEPALPGVAAGHNDRIAFGFTIVGMDQQDLYVEQVDPANADRYLYKGNWEPMRVERERVKVKGEPDRDIEMRFTRHGPVLQVDPARHRAFALRWVGSEPGSAGYLRSLMLDTAKDLPGFRAAVAGWKVPSENIVYADVDGNIAWVAAGLSPIRRNWTGLLPVPGQNGDYEWDGFLKLEDLPQLTNPASGFIATANHNILPPGYPHVLGYEFGAPWRFARILNRLFMPDGTFLQPNGLVGVIDSMRPNPTVEDCEAMQLDEDSIPARAIVTALSIATFQRPSGSDDQTAALAMLLPFARHVVAGGGRGGSQPILNAESAAAALYETWAPMLTSAFAEAFIAPADRQAGARMSTERVVDLLVEARLALPPPGMTCWVDGTPRRRAQGGGRQAEGARREAVSGADAAVRAKLIAVLTGPWLAQAYREMVKRQGPDPTKWAWGNMHHMSFEHPLAFTTDRQAVMNLAPVPRGGDATTPNATGAGARQTAGASYREVIDLSNWDQSQTINVPGESGQPESEFYGNLLPLWADGKYHQMAFSRAAVEAVAAHRLRLVPAK